MSRSGNTTERRAADLSSGATWLAMLILAFWAVEVVDWILPLDLDNWGLEPRSARGLAGIVTSPFLHLGFGHLASNTVPFFVLGGMVSFRGPRVFLGVTAFIAVVGGGALWLVGRDAMHIGASGLVFGYFGYLVTRAIAERRIGTFLIAGLVVFLYGGMIFSGINPSVPETVSWDGHLCGLLAGVLSGRKGERGR